MHVVFRESHGLEETEVPTDLGQRPADLVALSFSDSDLGAFAAGWKRAGGKLPTLRLANLVALRHPVSVDTYVENTLSGAKGILIRLIGGEAYWPYGLASVQDLCRRKGIALAVLPADGRDDERLDALSTLPVSTLRRLKELCDAGGAVAAQAALSQLALASGLYAPPVPGDKRLPDWGFYDPAKGVIAAPEGEGPLVLVSFYRSYLTSADTAPVDALIEGLRARGFAAYGLFAASLKAEGLGDAVQARLDGRAPALIVNATAFSAQGTDGTTPFDRYGVPVFQVALSTARKRDWAEAERGLSPADLAMHVVLPEVDGRLFAGVVSFKAPEPRDPDLEYARFAHRADAGRITAALDRITGWYELAQTPVAQRRLAVVLSTYPGRDWQMAHAVGLDALASTEGLLTQLADEGYGVSAGAPVESLTTARQAWPLAEYLAALETLPEVLRQDLAEAWGTPEDDPAFQDGAFHFAALQRGAAWVALQPERGAVTTRDDDYHDLSRTPRHAYVAFYLWLRAQGVQALCHMGAHGTLEWLPGKAVALSETCWPEALWTRPVIYPFIVNDPGEAAQAKRRLGAVTLGHLPPPLAQAAVPEGMTRLERLLDEYSTADGLDPARRDRLIADIRDEARASGVEDDLGIPAEASAAEAITRIDRFVCDIKESQFGDGLHVLGQGACGAEERAGLTAALSGARVAPGPSGSPARGRADVLPTGRNLFAVDPRAVPSRAAHAQGVKLAEELLRKHLQDQGDWPKGLVIDLWGSATMRTAGEEFAMALHLAGLKPVWDEGAARVSGVEVIPLALLGRPRIDVTLRVSGLFRDIFPGLAQLFETGAEALALREESLDDNPYARPAPRVFGPRPGQYGLGMGEALDHFTPEARAAAGEAWLNASSYTIDKKGEIRADRAGLEARLMGADSFVHAQDLPESDVLLAADYAAHEAGFAAALARLGAEAPALYHLDATDPARPRARTLPEEIARVVRARATNPAWVSGMMRHGFRGGAEIAATLDHMAAFAHLAQVVPAHLFDLYHEATLGDEAVVDFLETANPQALAAMRDLFRRLAEAGLWQTRRNSIAASLEERL
ncbi:cobaltochelatase CobN subunit [Rhodobacter aestuarii]|uniref:Cobaltochelatase CobN subunit n=1 Tax=Rhodobacter aestuarii TaxID=453582 RepID=A0A1N7J3Z3_9RHOB|nr:cobaltochelatase subunit CobN [Rhodobacter aestuarii]PTV97222.1 cobaltochelatase CobN subunit [Rhodobacter aestuarii]SIS43957.1 cobaltochelatase CobN subunit [Rhodobacter aestuarii]